jgi:hypothetical protein
MRARFEKIDALLSSEEGIAEQIQLESASLQPNPKLEKL